MTSYSDQILTVELNGRVFRISKNQRLSIFKNNDNINEVSGAKKKTDAFIPKASFTVLPDARKPDFKLPNEYIRYNGCEAENDEDKVEYDVDKEDSVWLKLANERRKRLGKKQIRDDTFELAIDRLEKESHFQIASGESAGNNPHFPQVDNDAACCICNDTEDSNVNQIIFCDMCNIPVHQECYGVPYIPEGQWLCRRCQLSPSVPVSCALCPYAFGAFKQTSCGQWAHVICALWLNEVHFANVVFNEPIEGINYALKRRAKLRCIVCRQKCGACLQCSARVCRASFHVTCGFFAGFYMEVKSESSRNSGGVNRYAFCMKHYPESKKPKTSENVWKRMMNRQILQAKTQVLSTAREAPQISIPVIPAEKIEKIREDLKLDGMEDICYYWALKRRSRFGVPLIRRLQVYQTQKTLRRPDDSKPVTNQQASTHEEFSDSSVQRFTLLHRKRKNITASPTRSVRGRGASGVISPYASQMHSPVVGADFGTTPTSSLVVHSLGMGGGTIVGGASQPEPEQVYACRLRANLERVRLLCELVKKREKHKREFVSITETMLDRCAKAATGATLDYFVSRGEKSCGSGGVMELKTMLQHLNHMALLKESDLDENANQSLTIKSNNDYDANRMLIPGVSTANMLKMKRRGAPPGRSVKRGGKTPNIDRTFADERVSESGGQKRKTRIDDFFAAAPSSDRVEMTPSTSFASSMFLRSAPAVRSIAPATAHRTKPNEFSNSRRCGRRPSYMRTETLLSDISADDLTATSIDDDDEIETSSPIFGSQRGGGTIRGRRGVRHRSRTPLSAASSPTTRLKKLSAVDTPLILNGSADDFVGRSVKRKRRLPGRAKYNEFDSADPNLFAHNDIVWVRMDDAENNLEMPARVIDLRMRAFLDDKFPVDKALQAKPSLADSGGQQHTLVVLFDTAKTWKWIPTSRLSPCDLNMPPKNISSHPRSPCDAALKRARQFWKEMLRE